MQGYFCVHKNTDEDYDIVCDINESLESTEIPEIQQNLYVEIESTCNIIKSLKDTNKEKKDKYFNKLLSLSQGGLVSDHAQPELAQKALIKLKEEILINEGSRIKNEYMKKLGCIAILISSVLGVIGFAFWKCNFWDGIYMYIIIGISAMAGSWLSFGARKFIISFEELSVIEEDKMAPLIRLIYVLLCSVLFTVLLRCGIFNIKFGNIDSANISTNIELQIIVGAMCGLVESKLGIKIYQKAESIVGD